MSELVSKILRKLHKLAWGKFNSVEELQNEVFNLWNDTLNKHLEVGDYEKKIKRQAAEEILALHEQDRAKVNSQCDTLINMSTVYKYLRGLE